MLLCYQFTGMNWFSVWELLLIQVVLASLYPDQEQGFQMKEKSISGITDVENVFTP